jgi:glycosyltransferase involved in cell wall biosynthesis
MRILFILENYYPHIGGVEIVFRNLCEGLAAKGHAVTVLTHRFGDLKKEETVGGVRIVRVSCLQSRYIFTLSAIPKAIQLAGKSDIIHTTTYNAAFPSWIARLVKRKPAVITVHENWIGRWREYSNFSWPVALAHDILERLVYIIPRFDRYICVSESTKRQLLRVYPGRASKITSIHNGFDDKQWSAPSKAAPVLRKRLGLERKFVIFASGRPGTTKGFEYLLAAFPAIVKKIPHAVLVLMLSKDPQYRHVIDEYRQQAHKDVLFLDPVRYNELIAYRQMADCNVVPSVTEGFGYAVLESAATGKPVVASDTTSIPEVIYGKYILVPPRNPKAIAEAVIKVSKGQYNTAPPRRFPWKSTITAYEKEYKSLVKR